jgi:hypothetical protein
VLSRGKVLGGSSAINFEIFNRPASTEYSAWSALLAGQGSWVWDNLLPYFLKSQTLFSPLPEDAFPDPTPTKRRRDEATDQGASIPTEFLDIANSALNATVLDVNTLLDAAGAADTLGTSTTSDNSTTTEDPATTETAAAKRSLLETRADTSGTGPVKGSYNTWYSDVASPFIHTVLNDGIPLNNQPVRLFHLNVLTSKSLNTIFSTELWQQYRHL